MQKVTVLRFAAAGLGIWLAAAGAGAAQEAGEDTGPPPVLNPETSLNGVDMVTGAFSAASPFSLTAPAAASLGYRSSVNGRQWTPSPSSYPSLHEKTMGYFGEWWFVTVTTGGGAHNFNCELIDPETFTCDIADDNRGVSLKVSEFTYNVPLHRADPKSTSSSARTAPSSPSAARPYN